MPLDRVLIIGLLAVIAMMTTASAVTDILNRRDAQTAARSVTP